MHSNVRSIDLFAISKPINPLTWMFLVNRLQTLYYIFFLPNIVTDPSMIWLILLAAACSHFNIWLLGNWFRQEGLPEGYLGTFRLFGRKALWLLSLIGLPVLLIKCALMMLGYVEIVHYILFPSLTPKLFVVLLLFACLYLARLGMEQTLRFSVIAFIGTFWIIVFYIPFILPPKADYYHLLPLIPDRVVPYSWQMFLMLWTAFAGPEYLLALPKKAMDDRRFKRYLRIGNVLSAIEYVFFIGIALLFYGPEYLQKLDFPVVQLIRYIQLPIAERLEMFIIPAYALSVIYVVAVFLLYATGALQIVTGTSHRWSKRNLGVTFVLLLSTTLAIQHWGWANETGKVRWIEWHNWLDASTYAALPLLLLIAKLRIQKRGARHATHKPTN
ncbi:spore germination protein GerAB [Paenibacillus sp. 32O-W]|jgi:Phosphoglycerol transferase and related proteins, alkaline phosphatase superfamily|nr:spore germination protein GerAB [Paenibacillus sp. 32O-W]